MELGDTCAEATRLITKDRRTQYGPPLEDFTRTASLFNVLTGHDVKPDEICLLMICVKLSRETNVHKVDNLVDLVGYADILNTLRTLEGA